METLRSKDKRAGIRVPLLSETIYYFYNGREYLTEVADITNQGLFVKTSELLRPRTSVLLRLNLPGDLGTLSVEARVVRVNWTVSRRKGKDILGMGLQFENVDPNIRKIVDAYVVYLRNKQIITVSKRIIEEFFGNDPKKLL